MYAAVCEGDVEELAELMRQDPGFDVNMDLDGDGYTFLHFACLRDSRSAVIPLLLAHPDVDVNVKNKGGATPFFYACCGSISLPEAIHHLMTSRWPSEATNQSGAHPYLLGSFTLTLESFSISQTQEVNPW